MYLKCIFHYQNIKCYIVPIKTVKSNLEVIVMDKKNVNKNAISKKDEKKVKERLRALGYLD